MGWVLGIYGLGVWTKCWIWGMCMDLAGKSWEYGMGQGPILHIWHAPGADICIHDGSHGRRDMISLASVRQQIAPMIAHVRPKYVKKLICYTFGRIL